MTTPLAARAFDPHDPLDLDLTLSAEELALRARVRTFVRERVLPSIEEHDRCGTFDRALPRELGALGLLGMSLEGYGCPGTSATAYGLACLELEAGDSGLRSFVSVQSSLAMFALRTFGDEATREEWLPRMARGEAIGCFGLTEPLAGSDPAAMTTSARRDGGDWILRGHKRWSTNGGIADVAVIWARADDGIRGFAVPTAARGFETRPIEGKRSLRASVSSELLLDDVRLPAAALLTGARGLRAPLACLGEARFGIVFGALGAARACYEAALDRATTRSQFGKPIAAFQLSQAKFVRMALALHQGLALALHLGRKKDAGTLRPEQISFAKLSNVDAALRIAREARTLLGGDGVTAAFPVMRHLANLESVLTYEGTAEIHTLALGKALTGFDAFS